MFKFILLTLLMAGSLLCQIKKPFILNSEPSGAKVFINDDEVGVTPFTLGDYSNKLLNIKLVKDGYPKWKESIIIDPLQGANINAILDTTYNLINVTSNMKNCDVFIDGVLVGKTPLERFKTKPGKIVLEVKKTEYKVFKKTLADLRVEREIKAKLIPNFSFLSFDYDINSGIFKVNGSVIDPKSPTKVEIGKNSFGIESEEIKNAYVKNMNIIPNHNYNIKIRKKATNYMNVVYSALIPGLGQYNNDAQLKGAGIFSGFLLSVAGYLYSDNEFRNKKDELADAMRVYKMTYDPNIIVAKRLKAEEIISEGNSANTFRNISLISAAVIYLYNLVDVILFHTEETKVNISVSPLNNLEFKVEVEL